MYVEYVVIALAIAALVVGVVVLKRAKPAKTRAPAAPVAVSAVDMAELSGLHPDIKQAYRGAVVDKLAPAAARIVNAAWTRQDEAVRKRKLIEMDAVSTIVSARLDDARLRTAVTHALKKAADLSPN